MSSFEVLSEYLKSEYLWAVIVRSLSKSSKEWCHSHNPTIWCYKDKLADKEWSAGALFGYSYLGQPVLIFCPSNKYVGKVVPYLIPSSIRGRPELYEEDRGPRWVLFCQNASERAQAQREASTTSRLWALTHPHGPHPAHHHQSYPSQAPLGAQRPDTSGNNI